MKKLLLVGSLFLVMMWSGSSHALIILFDEGRFDQPWSHADWIGEIIPGTAPFFFEQVSIHIGECVIPSDCLYDRPIGFANTHFFTNNPQAFHENIEGPAGRLGYLPFQRIWSTENGRDSVLFRGGVYCGVGIDPGCVIPEPSTLLLLGAGLAILGFLRWKRWL